MLNQAACMRHSVKLHNQVFCLLGGDARSTGRKSVEGRSQHARCGPGLLVAWGGLTKQAEELRRTKRLSIQVWTSEDLLDRLFSVYGRLSDECVFAYL